MIMEAIKINGYGIIEHSLEVKFKTPFSVLVGKNASGKSTILSAIRNRVLVRLNDNTISIIPGKLRWSR